MMSAQEVVNGWLAEIASEVGTPLRLSPEGVCVLAFDDGIDVTIEVHDEGDLVHLHSQVCPVAAGPGREALLERALALNLFQQGTSGATLGYDRDANALVLYRRWTLDRLDSEAMADAIAGQVIDVGEVRDRLSEAGAVFCSTCGEEHPPGLHDFGIRG
jgi:hypothetical protein